MRMFRAAAAVAAVLSLAPVSGVRAQTLTPAFTYQGELRSGGAPVTTPVDVRYRLFDAASGGSQIGGTLQTPNLTPSEGRISVSLDFGAGAYTGQRRWLAIEAAPAGTGQYVALTPRQELAAAPFATYAANIPAQYATFTTQGGSAVFTSGDVGIGTATPGAGLHVSRVGAGGLAMNVNDRLYVSDSSAFVGVNRTSRVTNAETFGLQNTAAQTGFTGMYIRSTFTTGLPFYGYTTPGATGWTQMDNAGAWSLVLGGTTRFFATAAGNVGIGTITPSTKLDVTGVVRATGFQFPDGSIQSRAALDPGLGGSRSGLATTARYRVLANGVEQAGAVLANDPSVNVPLDASGVPAGGRTLVQQLKLRRPAAGGVVWFTAFNLNQALAPLTVELSESGTPGGTPRVVWNFGTTRITSWRVLTGDDGSPVEEITLWYSAPAVTRTVTGAFAQGLPAPGARTGSLGGGGAAHRVRFGGVLASSTVVRFDLSQNAPTDLATGQRTGRITIPRMTVLTNASESTDLYTRWVNGTETTLDVLAWTSSAQTTLFTATASRLSAWTLVRTDDGGLAEEYLVTGFTSGP